MKKIKSKKLKKELEIKIITKNKIKIYYKNVTNDQSFKGARITMKNYFKKWMLKNHKKINWTYISTYSFERALDSRKQKELDSSGNYLQTLIGTININ